MTVWENKSKEHFMMMLRTLVLIAGLLISITASLMAQVPQYINYQGKLTRTSGATVDTTVQMVFSIYADAVTSNFLWRETQPYVEVVSSVFNVLLGDATTIPPSVFDGNIRYLGIRVGSDAEMSPRRPITSAAYAYRSQNTDVLDGHHWGEVYPSASSADAWDGHHWSDIYPNADAWDGHHWGEVYPTATNATNATNAANATNATNATNASNSDLCDGIHGTSFLRNDVSGNVNGTLGLMGFNCINFYVEAGAAERIRYDNAAISGHNGMLFTAHNTREFIFGTLNSSGAYTGTRMTIPAKGAVSMSDGLDVSGDVHAASFRELSDLRLKTNINPLVGVLDKIDQLKGVSFEWNDLSKSLGRSTDRREIGVIAQDIDKVFPELVGRWGDNGYESVDYGRLSAVLLEGIKELKAENALLKERIEKLEKGK
jgi:hypothetical protein